MKSSREMVASHFVDRVKRPFLFVRWGIGSSAGVGCRYGSIDRVELPERDLR